jgi:predicted RNase H-like HicB family nuclease
MKRKTPKLDYQINLRFDQRDNIYVAFVPELANCHSHGETPFEALEMIQEAIDLWIQAASENDIPIPKPINQREFSGRFLLRTSPNLHKALASEALKHGKSMNEFVVDMLQTVVG